MRWLVPLLLMAAPVAAQTTAPVANSINNTSAGQATGTVLNSNTQLNQMPVMQQEYGAGYRCQNSTISFSPYYVGSAASYGESTNASGFGAMLTLSAPLDRRGIEECMKMARARVAKEQFDLEMTKALRCADLVRAGVVFTTPTTQKLCDGIAYNPKLDSTKGVVLPEPPKQTPQLVITR